MKNIVLYNFCDNGVSANEPKIFGGKKSLMMVGYSRSSAKKDERKVLPLFVRF